MFALLLSKQIAGEIFFHPYFYLSTSFAFCHHILKYFPTPLFPNKHLMGPSKNHT